MSHLAKIRYTNKVTPENTCKLRNKKLSSAIVSANQKPALTLCQKDLQNSKVPLLLIKV